MDSREATVTVAHPRQVDHRHIPHQTGPQHLGGELHIAKHQNLIEQRQGDRLGGFVALLHGQAIGPDGDAAALLG